MKFSASSHKKSERIFDDDRQKASPFGAKLAKPKQDDLTVAPKQKSPRTGRKFTPSGKTRNSRRKKLGTCSKFPRTSSIGSSKNMKRRIPIEDFCDRQRTKISFPLPIDLRSCFRQNTVYIAFFQRTDGQNGFSSCRPSVLSKKKGVQA